MGSSQLNSFCLAVYVWEKVVDEPMRNKKTTILNVRRQHRCQVIESSQPEKNCTEHSCYLKGFSCGVLCGSVYKKCGKNTHHSFLIVRGNASLPVSVNDWIDTRVGLTKGRPNPEREWVETFFPLMVALKFGCIERVQNNDLNVWHLLCSRVFIGEWR